jgi:hypothetical protein
MEHPIFRSYIWFLTSLSRSILLTRGINLRWQPDVRGDSQMHASRELAWSRKRSNWSRESPRPDQHQEHGREFETLWESNIFISCASSCLGNQLLASRLGAPRQPTASFFDFRQDFGDKMTLNVLAVVQNLVQKWCCWEDTFWSFWGFSQY